MIFALPYCLITILMLLISIRLTNSNDSISNVYLQRYLIILIWVFFIGFRGLIVTDWQVYYIQYNITPSLIDNDFLYCFNYARRHYFETGYVLFSVLMRTFGVNFFYFQLISLIIDLLLLYKLFTDYCKAIYFPFFLFIYFIFQGFIIEVNLLRNSKAILLFMISIKYINKRDLKKYIILNLIGFFFHKSAIIYFPLYWLLQVKINRRKLLIIFLIANIVYLFRIKWIGGIIQIIAEPLSHTMFRAMVIDYGLVSGKYTAEGIGFGFLERTITFLLVLKYQKSFERNKRYELTPFCNLIFLFVLVYLFFSELAIIPARVSTLFIVAYPVVYCNIYSEFKKQKKMIFIFIIGLYAFLKMFAQCNEQHYKYENYLFDTPNYEERLLITP